MPNFGPKMPSPFRLPFLLLLFGTFLCFVPFFPSSAAQRFASQSKQQRSRQIHAQSQIVANLFANYDPNQRPPVRESAEHSSIVVTTSVVIDRVVWHAHSAEVDLNLHQDWEDSRLSFDVDPREGISEVTVPRQSVVWRPDTFFARKNKVRPMGDAPRKLDGQSSNNWHLRTLRVNFQADGAFPIRDKRTIRLAISSATYPIEDVVYLWANSPPLIQPIQVADHLYEGGEAQYLFEEAEAGDCPFLGNLTANSFSCIELIVRFRSSVGRALLGTLIPSALLILISWFHFWVHSSWSVPRTLSAAIPFLIFICLLLLAPAQSAALRTWFLLCSVFALLSLVEYFLVIRHYTTVAMGGNRLATLQRFSRPLSALDHPQQHQAQNGHSHLEEERKATPTTTTTVVVTQDEPLIQHGESTAVLGHGAWHSNKLDVVSRVAFPIAFLLATCIYILFYLYF